MATLEGMVGLPLQGKLVDAFGTGTAWQIAGVAAMFKVLSTGGQAGRKQSRPQAH
jgi:hypothetical protein